MSALSSRAWVKYLRLLLASMPWNPFAFSNSHSIMHTCTAHATAKRGEHASGINPGCV